MTDNILAAVKETLGLQADYTPFDSEILLHINSVFSTLTQLGVGEKAGFYVEDASEWDDVFDDPRLNMVKSYIFLRVKLLFDPPQVGFVITAMKEQIEQLEWRIAIQVDEIYAELNPVVTDPVSTDPFV